MATNETQDRSEGEDRIDEEAAEEHGVLPRDRDGALHLDLDDPKVAGPLKQLKDVGAFAQQMKQINAGLNAAIANAVRIPKPADFGDIRVVRPDERIVATQRETLDVMREMFEVQKQIAIGQADGFEKLQASTDETTTWTRIGVGVGGLVLFVALLTLGATIATLIR